MYSSPESEYQKGYRDARNNKPPRTGASQDYLRGYEKGRKSLYNF